MNYRIICRITGKTMLITAAFMLLSLLVALYYRESPLPFLYSIGLLLLLGAPMSRVRASKDHFFSRDGFSAVAAIWLVLSLFGALPFFFSGHFNSYVDCFFEIVSGFTTTGASILTAVEGLPRGILFWRSFSHWLGGMGVLIFAIALGSGTSERTHHLMRAESPGPSVSKLVPKIRESTTILYAIYVALTLMEIIALKIAGMGLYDAVVHSFGTAGTGGFSVKNLSIAYYESAAIDYIIGIFMILFGVNFTVYFLILTRRFSDIRKNGELLFYLCVLGAAMLAVTINIRSLYSGFSDAFRYAFFQVSSIMTTTGFATADFNRWPDFSKTVLVTVMLIGACSGSTGGGIKCTRILVLLKSVKREIQQLVHPNSVKAVKTDGVIIPEATIRSINQFFAAFIFTIIVACLFVSLDDLGMTTTLTGVIACICNIGPGLELVGPMGNYSAFSDLSKIVLSLCMLIGRLEVYPILILFTPSVWKKM